MSDLNAKIIPLYSEVLERVPTVEQVDIGEIAVNIADRKIYTKNTAGEIVILGEGAGGGLPGGEYLPNFTNPGAPIGKWVFRGLQALVGMCAGSDRDGDAIWASDLVQVSYIDDNGNDVSAELEALGEGTDSFWVSIDGNQTLITPPTRQWNADSCRFYFTDTELGDLTGATEIEIFAMGVLPADPIPLPLYEGDVLRYDGTNWRPIQYRLESLDDVQGRSGSGATVFWVLRADNNSPLSPGEATVNNRVNLHPIDSEGVDRTQDFKDWRDDLLGITGGPGDQDNWNGTLTFIRNGTHYPVTVTIVDDDMTDSGANQPAFQIECDFASLYPLLVDSGQLELKEFSEFLGLSVSSGFDDLADGSVLQYRFTTNTWVAQPLVYSLDDAANVALRVDAGSGTEIPKAIGDALLWDGSYWRPANPLAGQSISALDDVNTATVTPANGQALVWDEANGYWKPGTVASDTPEVALSDLTDTTLTSPAQNQVLKYVDGVWVNAAVNYADIPDAPTVPQDLGDLPSVDLSLAPVAGQVLVWDGTAWRPEDQSGGGGGDSVVGALTERADVAVTETFTPGETKNLVFSGMGEAGKFVQVTVSDPAWIRFYASDADRSADATRGIDDDPLPGSGVLMELRTSTVDEVVKITPGAIYYNNDLLPAQSLYARLTSQAGIETAITTTIRAYTSSTTDAIDGGTFGSG